MCQGNVNNSVPRQCPRSTTQTSYAVLIITVPGINQFRLGWEQFIFPASTLLLRFHRLESITIDEASRITGPFQADAVRNDPAPNRLL